VAVILLLGLIGFFLFYGVAVLGTAALIGILFLLILYLAR
jgi:hypothetical protein